MKHATLAPGWRNEKHASEWLSTLKHYAFPIIGDLPVDEITTDDIRKVLEPIWSTHNTTASRLRGRIEQVLDAAKVLGKRHGENPARWKGHLQHVLAKPSDVHQIKGHNALPWTDLPGFMVELAKRDGVPARAVAFAGGRKRRS